MDNNKLIKFVYQNKIYYLYPLVKSIKIYDEKHSLLITHYLKNKCNINNLTKLALEIYYALVR